MTTTLQTEAKAGPLTGAPVDFLVVYVTDLACARAFYEETLGLRVAAENDASITYETGATRLWLRRASDDGIELPGTTDDSCDIVFLTENAVALRNALERRGLAIAHQRTYGVGTVVDFYDPDGHRLMIYEPSEHALTTPVASNLRDLWRKFGRGGTGDIGSPAQLNDELADQSLDGKPIVYYFLFIRNLADGSVLFESQLGLDVLDRSHCCSDGCPNGEPGVVKYDGQGVILSTHHMHGHHSVLDDRGQPYAARDYDPAFAKGVAPVFRVDDIARVRKRLAELGVSFRERPIQASTGTLEGFEAPSGHLLYLLEPAGDRPTT